MQSKQNAGAVIRGRGGWRRAIGGSLVAALAFTGLGAAMAAPKSGTPAPSSVVHPAPDFAWIGAGGKTYPAKNFRGQPVVILVAPSPDARTLRQEAGRIEELYLGFSAKKTIFVVAFTGQTGRVASDVPYAVAANGASVAAAYGANPNSFSVIVISPDGNVDMVSNKVEGAQRILDIINNTYQTQAAVRTGIGS